MIIGDPSELFADSCLVKNVNLIGGTEDSFSCRVKIRYLGEPVPARVFFTETEDLWQVRFDAPQKSVTPGQFAVFYDEKDALLGGGEIL